MAYIYLYAQYIGNKIQLLNVFITKNIFDFINLLKFYESIMLLTSYSFVSPSY